VVSQTEFPRAGFSRTLELDYLGLQPGVLKTLPSLPDFSPKNNTN